MKKLSGIESVSDWQNLRAVLDRCAQGPPAGWHGTFQGTVLTVCQMLRGSVIMEKDGVRVASSAKKMDWIVCVPGERTQHFSDDAEIISVHLAIRPPGNGAEWRGVPILAVNPDAPARASLRRLCETPAVRGMTRGQSLKTQGVPLPLGQALELQEATAAFFRHLLRLVSSSGLDFVVPEIADPRVRESRQRLASTDAREAFSRSAFAAGFGLTAGQLDRLWREEMGMTPRQYRDRQRMAYACEELRRHKTSIKAVASGLGFRHLSQFSNWFALRQGESPRRFQGHPEPS